MLCLVRLSYAARAWRCRLCSCRAGEAGGRREAAAGEKSPRAMTMWLGFLDSLARACAWEWALRCLGAGCSNATRSVRAAGRKRVNGYGTAQIMTIIKSMRSFVCRCRWEKRAPVCQRRDNNDSLPTLCYRPRCRKSPPTKDRVAVVVCSRHRRCHAAYPILSTQSALSPIPVRNNGHVDRHKSCPRGNARRLRQAGNRAGTQRTAYPNAYAARHRLLFAASRNLRAVSR